MEQRFEVLMEKQLVGKRMSMSYANNKTGELWRSFMPRRNEVTNTIGQDFYSIQIYPPSFFEAFDPNMVFEKWATVEVNGPGIVPDGMETIILPTGLYAVFNYKGTAGEASAAFSYILNGWLPNSGHSLDNRPHFEKLGEKYKKDDPGSEEEIWIPVRPNP
jgi:AraC family transcriptional regulator